MGTRADFYKVAAENHVEVLRYPMPIIGSMSTEVNGACYIGLDNSKPCTYAEEQARIGHELGHCLYGGFYSMATPFDIVERHEVRADHWYIRHAIPKQVLFDLLKQGVMPMKLRRSWTRRRNMSGVLTTITRKMKT